MGGREDGTRISHSSMPNTVFIFLLLPPFSLQPITCTSKVVIGEFPNFNSLSPLSVCLCFLPLIVIIIYIVSPTLAT